MLVVVQLACEHFHLLIQPVDFAEVGDGFHGPQHIAQLVPQYRGVFEGRQKAAVLADDCAAATAQVFLVRMEKLAPSQVAADEHRFTRVASNQFAGAPDDFLGAVTGQMFKGPVDHKDGALGTDQHEPLVHGVNDPVPMLAEVGYFHFGLIS